MHETTKNECILLAQHDVASSLPRYRSGRTEAYLLSTGCLGSDDVHERHLNYRIFTLGQYPDNLNINKLQII